MRIGTKEKGIKAWSNVNGSLAVEKVCDGGIALKCDTHTKPTHQYVIVLTKFDVKVLKHNLKAIDDGKR